MDPLIGRTVGGRYTLLSVLGHGGEGVVYLAEQEGLGREVVVKLMRADLGLDPSALKRFDREKVAKGYTRARMISALTLLRADETQRQRMALGLEQLLRRAHAPPAPRWGVIGDASPPPDLKRCTFC